MLRHALWCLLALLAPTSVTAQDAPPTSPPAQASPPAPAQQPAGTRIDDRNLPDICTADEQRFESDHFRHIGRVTCMLPDGGRVFGDTIDVFGEEGSSRIVAEGHVVFDGPDGHISAEKLEYHTGTGTGVFYLANGFLRLGETADRRQFGGQDPDVAFYGDKLERLGSRRFRVTNGGWTTCTQPTPRWVFTAGSAMIVLDDYVMAKNTILRVKGVPLFYWPFIYYPIQSDERATGFLLPTYGTSTIRGQAISNAFFWAISRSQDATFYHDWFTRAGQGAGVEYRYVANTQSSGNVTYYRFNRDETTFTENGTTSTLAASNSFELDGSAIHALAPGVIARARLDYFSDVVNQQLLHQNLYDASQRNRLLEGGLTAVRGRWSSNLLYQRTEMINGVDDTIVYGGTPRFTATLAPQRLFDSPIYGSFNTDLAYLPYRHVVGGTVLQDNSFGRLDASPSIRVPLSRLPYLSANTSAAYRTTYYTRQASELPGQTEEGGYFRQYASVRTEVVGPVLSRIFDLGESGFAERVKHVIEPTVTLDLVSPIHDFHRTPLQGDVSDFIIGGTTRITYGVTNRLFFRKATVNGVRGATREFLTVGVQQTSYSNEEAKRYDTTYSTAIGVGPGSTLSPIALTARVSPTNLFDGNLRAEYDLRQGLQTLTTGASINVRRGGTTLNYSRQQFDRSLPANSFLSASTRASFLQDRATGTYNVSWDISRGYVVSQGVIGSYMAQCCGIQAEYQQFNYPTGFGLPVTTDRRINFAFVLAGLGTFSNFFGAFGGR